MKISNGALFLAISLSHSALAHARSGLRSVSGQAINGSVTKAGRCGNLLIPPSDKLEEASAAAGALFSQYLDFAQSGQIDEISSLFTSNDQIWRSKVGHLSIERIIDTNALALTSSNLADMYNMTSFMLATDGQHMRVVWTPVRNDIRRDGVEPAQYLVEFAIVSQVWKIWHMQLMPLNWHFTDNQVCHIGKGLAGFVKYQVELIKKDRH